MLACFTSLGLVAVTLAGCEGGVSQPDRAATSVGTSVQQRPASGSAPQAPDDESQIRDVANRYYSAFWAGNGETACSLLSSSSKQSVLAQAGATGIGDTCAEGIAAVAKINKAAGKTRPTTELTQLEISGVRARATLLENGQPIGVTFERENGDWRIGFDSRG